MRTSGEEGFEAVTPTDKALRRECAGISGDVARRPLRYPRRGQRGAVTAFGQLAGGWRETGSHGDSQDTHESLGRTFTSMLFQFHCCGAPNVSTILGP